MGLPAVNEFGVPSSNLEFDKFDDDMPVEGGVPEGSNSDGQPAEGINGCGTEEDGEKGEKPEPTPKKKTKPPTVDEYQWQWKVRNLCFKFRVSAN